jgi:hypothetical protein
MKMLVYFLNEAFYLEIVLMFAEFEALPMVLPKIQDFWDLKPC